MGTENIGTPVSEGRWEGKLDSHGGGEENRAIRTVLYCLLKNSMISW